MRKEDDELRRAEHAVQLAQFSLDYAPDAVYWMEPDGRFIYANQRACEMLGYSQSEMMNMRVVDIDLDLLDGVPPEMSRATKEAEVGRVEMQQRTKDGRIIPVEVMVVCLEYEGTDYRCAFVRDISERKQADKERERLLAELKAKNRELENFTYAVSHDLKAPLLTINGFLGRLEGDVATGRQDHIQDDMRRILGATAKVRQLLDGLLELSRIGRIINTAEEIKLPELLDELVETFFSKIKDREVQVEIDRSLPSVLADRARLLQVYENLFANALKYFGDSKHPRIEFGFRREHNIVVYFVIDNGIGIEPHLHEKVFELFEKLDAKSEGAGVGLTLCKCIVEAHGGRIWVESEGKGQGSTFCFTLPGQKV